MSNITMRAILSGLAAMALAIIACAEDVTPAPMELRNEFIRVVVNPGPEETGRFSIQTTGGDPARPASQEQHLIFGGRSPWTSYTTVLLDGQPHIFGGPTTRRAGRTARYGNVVTPPMVRDEDGVLTTVTAYDTVTVAQELALARGASTRMLDTVRVTYRVSNTGSAPREVGLRVMLDTMLGTNDGAPVRAGNDAITVAKYLVGDALPDYWQAFDSLSNPTVVSQGTLRGVGAAPPDKMLFVDWGTVADDPWMPELESEQTFIRKGELDPDTATAIFWQPTTVAPGQTKIFTTYYGIGDVSLQAGQMALGLTAPAETTFLHERTEPVTITGYVENAGGFTARGIVVNFTLPDGLQLMEGTVKEQVAVMEPGAIIQRRWVVRPNGTWEGTAALNFKVTTSNVEPNQMARKLEIHVPKPRILFSPAAQTLSVTTSRVKPVLTQINLTPAENFYGIRLTVAYDSAVVSPIDVSRGRAFVENDALLDGWDFEYDDDAGTITISGERRQARPMTQAEINLALLKFRVVAPGISSLRLVRAVMVDEDGGEHPVNIDEGHITITPASR